MLLKTFVFAFTVYFVLVLTSGLYCYQCHLKNGIGDEGCDLDPPPEKYIRECAQPQCWMRHSSDRTDHIERFCVAMADNSNGCMRVMVEDDYGREHRGLECKCNRSDGCNGHTPYTPPQSLGRPHYRPQRPHHHHNSQCQRQHGDRMGSNSNFYFD